MIFRALLNLRCCLDGETKLTLQNLLSANPYKMYDAYKSAHKTEFEDVE